MKLGSKEGQDIWANGFSGWRCGLCGTLTQRILILRFSVKVLLADPLVPANETRGKKCFFHIQYIPPSVTVATQWKDSHHLKLQFLLRDNIRKWRRKHL